MLIVVFSLPHTLLIHSFKSDPGINVLKAKTQLHVETRLLYNNGLSLYKRVAWRRACIHSLY